MGTTTNYGYNVPVGSDNVNLLPQMAANFPMIDSDLKAVSNTGVGTATELVTGTVHALTRADRDRNVFKFVATSNFEAGETFEVDGTQVTAKTPDGRNLSTGAYVINSTVLCMLEGTLLTVLVNPAKALDSENLDGHPATYFATAAALSALDNQLGAVSSKVGTGVLDVGNDCVDGINTLNTHLTVTESYSVISATGSSMSAINHNAIKQNGMVTLNCSCSGNGLPQNSWVTVGTLVNGWRPSTQIPFIYSDNNSVTSIGRIGTNGLIELVNPNANTTGVLASATFNVTFHLAN